MIDRLEHAGLGYHVDANQTVDKLGTVSANFPSIIFLNLMLFLVVDVCFASQQCIVTREYKPVPFFISPVFWVLGTVNPGALRNPGSKTQVNIDKDQLADLAIY